MGLDGFGRGTMGWLDRWMDCLVIIGDMKGKMNDWRDVLLGNLIKVVV